MGMNESFVSSEVGLPLNNTIAIKKFDTPSCSDLFSKNARLPFFIGMALMVLQQWSGVNGIIYNVTTLIGGSGGVIFAAVQVGCTLIASFVCFIIIICIYFKVYGIVWTTCIFAKFHIFYGS